jgi:hypothetical protein
MKLLSFNTSLRLFYATAIVFLLFVFITGLPYYFLPLSERPHSGMHDQLKPGGFWGHGLGVIGSAMILLLLLYSVRKRAVFGIRFGKLPHWLDIHIFFGIIGPMLITLHTAMKFHGIVSISYFSMLAVALSGVFGRYVYMQIPRDARGHTLGLESIQERIDEIQRSLREQYHASPETTQAIKQFTSVDSITDVSITRAILSSIGYHLTIKRSVRKLRRSLSRGGQSLPNEMLRQVVALAHESSLLQRRIVYLDSMNELSHYWHVFHKPFAYIMLFIMVVHIGVTVAFGYRWIF